MGNIIRNRMIYNFIQDMCKDEIHNMLENEKQMLAWSSVSHCSNKGICTMNVAMPDFSAEYWVCYIPRQFSPIFIVQFPEWSYYSAITLYDSFGKPFSSVNSFELKTDNKRVFNHKNNSYIVNFSNDIKTDDIVIAVFRVYKPEFVSITFMKELPKVYFTNRNKPTLHINKYNLVKQSTKTYAINRGYFVGDKFNKFIQKYLQPINKSKYGTQFFYPENVVGMFTNANAIYVIAFLPEDKNCMIITGKVPIKQKWRPYFGIMATDYSTTNTISSLTFKNLENWGSDFVLYATRDKKQAILNGFDNKKHKLLLWKEAKGPLAVVTRYIHYDSFKDARVEINKLKSLKGINNTYIEGVGNIRYV